MVMPDFQRSLAQSLMVPTGGGANPLAAFLRPIMGAGIARAQERREQDRRRSETSALGRLLSAAERARTEGRDPIAAMSAVIEANPDAPGYGEAGRMVMEKRLAGALSPRERKTATDVTGRRRYLDTGEPAFPGVEAPKQPPKTRKLEQQGQVVTQEWDPEKGEFVEIARSPKRAGVEVNVGPTGVDYGDPPKGMAWARTPDGEIALRTDEATGFASPIAVPIAGGPVETKQAVAEEKAAGRRTQAQRTSDIVTQDIDRVFEIMDESSLPVTGFFGAAGSYVPGTPQHDVAQALQSVKAATAFDRLQEMRANSPTGGALGQVSNVEIGLLQSAMGSLEQSQSEAQFRRNLQRVRDIYSEIVNPQISDLTDEQLLRIDDPSRLPLDDLREYTERLEAMSSE